MVAYVIPGYVSMVFLFTLRHSYVLGLKTSSLTCETRFVTRCWISHQIFLPRMCSVYCGRCHVANRVSKAELRDIDYGIWHKI